MGDLVLKKTTTGQITLTPQDVAGNQTVTIPASTGTLSIANTSTSGGIFFGGATSGVLYQDASNLYWDDTNNRLGIGTNSPAQSLAVNGSVALLGSTSGSVVVKATAIAGSNTITFPATTGNVITSGDSGTVTQTMLGTNIAGNGPAFNAYANTNQSITSGVATKVTFAVEEFDTNNNFASSRFTPTVAGYYSITGFGYMLATASMTYGYILIYKNGAAYQGSPFYVPYGSSRSPSLVTVVMYLNGSGDYVEIYAQADGTSPVMDTASVGFQSRFSGALVRAA